MHREVPEHVREGVRYFRGRSQRPRVVAVREDLSFTPHKPVEPPRDPGREALQSAREVHRIVGFDYEMEVVPLDREVDEPEPRFLFSGGERSSERGGGTRAAQIPHVRQDAHRGVDRVACEQGGALGM